MKIRERNGSITEVFAVYCIGNEVMCLGLPKGYGGLVAFKLDEVDVIDPHISGDYIFFKNTGFGFYHHSLIEQRLLDDLLELDGDAYKRFLSILKSEGTLQKDFF